ncbi:unnamed protein product, partial [Candidula unifasciata]
TSFDFGPSFMDEVLRALDEKEKQISSSADTTPTPSVNNHTSEPSVKPPAPSVGPPIPARRESRTSSSSSGASVAPPLPTQPPRTII